MVDDFCNFGLSGPNLKRSVRSKAAIDLASRPKQLVKINLHRKVPLCRFGSFQLCRKVRIKHLLWFLC